MNKGRWIAAGLVVAIVVTILESIGHKLFMVGLYAQTASVWRPMDAIHALMPYGYISTLIVSFLLIYIFERGYEGRGSRIAEGLRFGIVIGLFTAIPMAVWTWIMLPIPAALAIGWFVLAMIDMLVAGVIIAAMYKKRGA